MNDPAQVTMSDYDFLPDGIDAGIPTDHSDEKPPAIVDQEFTGTQILHSRNERRIDLEKAIEMRLKGVSLEDIGKLFGVTKQAVHHKLKPYVDTDDINVEIWKKRKADILAGKQAAVLSLLTQDDIKKASPKDKVVMFGILNDKERLERGQSTSNVSVLFRVAEEAEKIQQEGVILEAVEAE